jgi:hypothetical protein
MKALLSTQACLSPSAQEAAPAQSFSYDNGRSQARRNLLDGRQLMNCQSTLATMSLVRENEISLRCAGTVAQVTATGYFELCSPPLHCC